MPDLRNYDSLGNVLAAHAAAVELADRQERVMRAAAGQKLLEAIVKPCIGPKKPKHFNSSLDVRRIKNRLYRVEGNLPLDVAVIEDQPALARLIMSGTYRTLANKRQSGPLQEDPLSCLVPQTADLTIVLADIERPQIVTSQLWASFNHQDQGDEATGFNDPHTGDPLAYDGNHYAGVVATLEEAMKIQRAACGV